MQIGQLSSAAIAASVWNALSRSLTVDPATDAGAATLVWTHATRTLTADPATDAGAATLVWTHATRTLTADPATDAGAATLVWTHATRTLTADPATDAGTATLVWGHSPRGLTHMGYESVLTATDTTLAASAKLDLRPSSGNSRKILIGVHAGAAGSLGIQSYDGTIGRNIVVVASGTDGGYEVSMGNSSVGVRLSNNDASNAANYMYAIGDDAG